jgi:hypothetical protein
MFIFMCVDHSTFIQGARAVPDWGARPHADPTTRCGRPGARCVCCVGALPWMEHMYHVAPMYVCVLDLEGLSHNSRYSHTRLQIWNGKCQMTYVGSYVVWRRPEAEHKTKSKRKSSQSSTKDESTMHNDNRVHLKLRERGVRLLTLATKFGIVSSVRKLPRPEHIRETPAPDITVTTIVRPSTCVHITCRCAMPNQR